MASASIWAAQCAESDVSMPSTKTLGASGSEIAVSPKRRMKYAKLGPKPFHGFTVSFGWVYGTGQVQRVQNRWLAQDWSEDTISPLYLFIFFQLIFFYPHHHQPSTCFFFVVPDPWFHQKSQPFPHLEYELDSRVCVTMMAYVWWSPETAQLHGEPKNDPQSW